MAALTNEQALMRDQAKAWASKQAPVQKFRAMRDSGIEQRFDSQTWAEIIEMGWTGILIPEEYGGSGLDYLTFGVVLEELVYIPASIEVLARGHRNRGLAA